MSMWPLAWISVSSPGLTAGASGAELANIINEGCLAGCALRPRPSGTSRTLKRAVETVIAGYQRKNSAINEKEKQIVAYHEIGHALVAAKQKDSPPRCTRSPSFPALPALWATPCRWMNRSGKLLSQEEALAKIATLTGGRAAEELIFGTGYLRRFQRHRAGHQAGPHHDHPLWHEPRL